MTKPTPKVKSLKAKSAQLLADRARQEIGELSPMSQMERSAEEAARKLGQKRMDEQLGAMPEESGEAKPCPKCGKPASVRAKAVARSFKSLWGEHTLVRNYHYCNTCKRGFAPRDIELGLPEMGELTADLEARVMDFAVNDSFGKGEERWGFHYPRIPLSSNQFRRSTERLGTLAHEANPILLQEAAKPQPPESTATLYMLMDGSRVPCIGEWKESKLGVFFREEEYLKGNPTQRGEVLKPRYVGCVGPQQEDFLPLMKAAFHVEAACRPERVVAVGDGAKGNWSLVRQVCPSAIQILDWYHALEHAMDLGKALLGEASPSLPLWQGRMSSLLFEGDVEALVQEVLACLDSECPESHLKAANDFIGYVRENAPRMRYRDFLDAGLIIGSGPVESGHRHVFQARMKRAGQHWSIRGADRMARLRAHYSTSGPQRFYASVHWAHRETVKLPVRTVSKKRRASNR